MIDGYLMAFYETLQQIGCIVVALADKLGITYKKALDMFYSSRTNERLHDERSGLYLMSDGYIVDEVILESTSGE